MENKKQEITKQQKNNNMLLDLIVKINRSTALLMQLLDFNNSTNVDLMLFDPKEYSNLDNALITIAEQLFKRHKQLITDYLNKQKENKGGSN